MSCILNICLNVDLMSLIGMFTLSAVAQSDILTNFYSSVNTRKKGK